jgi:hypothetical protein
VGICPYDCTVCLKAECRMEGCERTGENMMDTCEECGVLVISLHRSGFCVMCINSEP